MKKKNYKVGIDLGSKTIRVVVTTLDNDGSQNPRVITGAIEPSDGIRHGRIVSASDASRALKNAITKNRKRVRRKNRLCLFGYYW